jgi:hypothetical protein
MVSDEERKAEKELAAICRALGVTAYYQQARRCLEPIDR